MVSAVGDDSEASEVRRPWPARDARDSVDLHPQAISKTLVNGMGAQSDCDGMWKNLDALPFPSQTLEQREANEHPKLISSWNTGDATAGSQVMKTAFLDPVKLRLARRRDTADSAAVQLRFTCASSAVARGRARRIDRDAFDLNLKLDFD